MGTKKWVGSKLVLDPDVINEERKQTKKRFDSKRKIIKRIFYVGLGVIVLTLTITLPIVLTSSGGSNNTNDNEKTYVRKALIPNGNDIIVKFNEQLAKNKANANDYKKRNLYENIKKAMTSKLTQDVYYAIIKSELSLFTKLGNAETLINYVKQKIIDKEEKDAIDTKQSYLIQLMKKGYGVLNLALTNKELLKEAKDQYFASFELRTKAYQYLLAMIYLSNSKSKLKAAANAETLKEVWYLKTDFSGSAKEQISKEISKNTCSIIPEKPTIWGRVNFSNLKTLVSKSELTNLYSKVFSEAKDIRTIMISNVLNSTINNYLINQIIKPRIIKKIERSTQTQVFNALFENKDALVITDWEKQNKFANKNQLTWDTAWKVTTRTALNGILNDAKKDNDITTAFVKGNLKEFKKKIDAQSNLFDYATKLGLNPTPGSSDDDLRNKITTAWEDAIRKKMEDFLKTTDNQVITLTNNWPNNRIAPFKNEVSELKNIFKDFVPLATISNLSTFVGDEFKNTNSSIDLLNLYLTPIFSKIVDRVKTFLDKHYNKTEKNNFVKKYRDNPALDSNAFTWDRLSVFIVRVLVNKYVELFKTKENVTSYVNLEIAKIGNTIDAWDKNELKDHAKLIKIPSEGLTESQLKDSIKNAWRTKLTEKMNTFKVLSQDHIKTVTISHLFQNIPPKKHCGSLDNWNKVVLDTSLNKDDKYNNIRENYGETSKRMFGYLGFVRENSAPSILGKDIKEEIFKPTTGNNPFKSGLQERLDYDGVKRAYFIQNEKNKANAIFIVAKNADYNKFTFDNSEFNLEYTKNLLFNIVSTSTKYLSNARSYYLTSKKYRVFFYDDEVKSSLSSTLNPNNVKNLTKNSKKDPVKDTDKPD